MSMTIILDPFKCFLCQETFDRNRVRYEFVSIYYVKDERRIPCICHECFERIMDFDTLEKLMTLKGYMFK